MAKKSKDIDCLFQSYLNICNEAIEKHKDEFPYKGMLSVAKVVAQDKSIDLAIYDDKPKAAYSLSLRDNRLIEGELSDDVHTAWRVNLSYLKEVVDNPQEYINHPTKLDLEWLKSRLGF